MQLIYQLALCHVQMSMCVVCCVRVARGSHRLDAQLPRSVAVERLRVAVVGGNGRPRVPTADAISCMGRSKTSAHTRTSAHWSMVSRMAHRRRPHWHHDRRHIQTCYCRVCLLFVLSLRSFARSLFHFVRSLFCSFALHSFHSFHFLQIKIENTCTNEPLF